MTTEYTITRKGQNLVISNGTKSVSVYALGTPDELPPFAVSAIRKAGANPDDYFWFNGQAIRKTHRQIVAQLTLEARSEYEHSEEGLRAKRRSILDSIAGCAEEAGAIRTRNFHRYDTGVGMGCNEWDSKCEAARAELKAFDTAHPEIRAAIEAEKAEAAERFSRTN